VLFVCCCRSSSIVSTRSDKIIMNIPLVKPSTIVALTQASANTSDIRAVSAPYFSINLTKIKAGEVEKWLEEKDRKMEMLRMQKANCNALDRMPLV